MSTLLSKPSRRVGEEEHSLERKKRKKVSSRQSEATSSRSLSLSTHRSENKGRNNLDGKRHSPLSIVLKELTSVSDPVGDEAEVKKRQREEGEISSPRTVM